MDELLEQFMIEGRELISQATDDLAALERDPGASRRLESAFRAVHTLKGSVAIFELGPMGAVLHAAEDLLGSARQGASPFDVPRVQALLSCIDQCDRWMDAVEESGTLPGDAAKQAVRITKALAALTGASPGPGAAEDTQPDWLTPLLERHRHRLVQSGLRELVAIRYTPREDCFFLGDDPLAFAAEIPELVALQIAPLAPWGPLASFDPYRCNLVIEALSAAAMPDVRQVFRFVPDQVEIVDAAIATSDAGAGGGAADIARETAERTIRIETRQIDALLDLVGELVVAKNRLGFLAEQAETALDPHALAAALRANQAETERLIASMHRTVMGARMVPLERLFRRLQRLVREIAAELGRDVSFSVRGADTRVDKAIADALFEPLLHIVRNALDHGIELPEQRRTVGKADSGTLTLGARSAGDQIVIEVSDDGAGIDPAQVRRIAAKRGVRSSEEIAALDDGAAVQMIFLPGFSTAEQVTTVSGRGVGMDAVRAAVERLGGRIMLASRIGAGTDVTLRLPATAALTTVLVVEAAGEQLAVPIELVSETVMVPTDRVVPVGLGRAFVHRDRTLPFVSLAALLGLGAESAATTFPVLIVDTSDGAVGIAVDALKDRLDVLLRPMSGLMSKLPGVAGTTLLADGTVLLILNLAEVIG